MVREPVGAAPIHISLRRLEEDEISPGWLIIGGMVIFAILYIFFGTLYNSKVLDKEELPHAEFWRSLSGLVQDGVRYAFSCFSDTVSSSRAQAGGYTPVANVGFEVQEEEGERTKKFRKKQSPALVGRRTRLCEAAMVGTTKLVKQRLKSEEGQAELDRGDARGCTPFHHACAGGHVETVGLLIKAGCNTALTNDRKQTGWELASDTRRSAALEKLRSLAKGGHKLLKLEADSRAECGLAEAAAAASLPSVALADGYTDRRLESSSASSVGGGARPYKLGDAVVYSSKGKTKEGIVVQVSTDVVAVQFSNGKIKETKPSRLTPA